MVFKRIATFITVLVFSMTSAPSITLADVGDEDAGAFDDAVEEVQEDGLPWSTGSVTPTPVDGGGE